MCCYLHVQFQGQRVKALMKNVRGRKSFTFLEVFQSMSARPSGRNSVKIKNIYKDVRMVTDVALNKKSKTNFSWNFS